MTWGKLDDGFWRHPKVRAAAKRDPGAVGLFAQAISLSSEYETDGRLRDYDLEELCPRPRVRRRLIRILLSCGLLERVEDGRGYQIHDYLDHNPSKAELEAQRRNGSRRVRRHRSRRPGDDGEVQAA
jgi:hypothetical protein